jgi:hypothetical protein
MATAVPNSEPVSAQISFTVTVSMLSSLSSDTGLLCVRGLNLTASDRILSYRLLKNSVSLLTVVQNCKASLNWEIKLRNLAGLVAGDVLSVKMWCADASWLEWTVDYLSDGSFVFGIADTNAVRIDSADVADGEYARFTANGLEGRTAAEVLTDIGAGSASVSDTAYAASWDGVTDVAPSKNAVYDKIEALTIGAGITAEEAIAYAMIFG